MPDDLLRQALTCELVPTYILASVRKSPVLPGWFSRGRAATFLRGTPNILAVTIQQIRSSNATKMSDPGSPSQRCKPLCNKVLCRLYQDLSLGYGLCYKLYDVRTPDDPSLLV